MKRTGLMGLVMVIGLIVVILGFAFAVQVMMAEMRLKKHPHRAQPAVIDTRTPKTPAH